MPQISVTVAAQPFCQGGAARQLRKVVRPTECSFRNSSSEACSRIQKGWLDALGPPDRPRRVVASSCDHACRQEWLAAARGKCGKRQEARTKPKGPERPAVERPRSEGRMRSTGLHRSRGWGPRDRFPRPRLRASGTGCPTPPDEPMCRIRLPSLYVGCRRRQSDAACDAPPHAAAWPRGVRSEARSICRS